MLASTGKLTLCAYLLNEKHYQLTTAAEWCPYACGTRTTDLSRFECSVLGTKTTEAGQTAIRIREIYVGGFRVCQPQIKLSLPTMPLLSREFPGLYALINFRIAVLPRPRCASQGKIVRSSRSPEKSRVVPAHDRSMQDSPDHHRPIAQDIPCRAGSLYTS